MNWGLLNLAFSYTTIGGITAHKHTNAIGDGGALDKTTLLVNGTLWTEVIALG